MELLVHVAFSLLSMTVPAVELILDIRSESVFIS